MGRSAIDQLYVKYNYEVCSVPFCPETHIGSLVELTVCWSQLISEKGPAVCNLIWE